ncbi:hypothetical protein GE09DRAFT_359541 [Coniochaeta sp. 2T2.1]|nr:hypothetical protein GE09DRAFT_359541 [Coniochaeta sp. 2T2.1]
MQQYVLNSFLRRWHRMLGLPRQTPTTWYRDRVREELKERRSATTRIHRLSETADVFFAISRARHDGIYAWNLPPFVASRHLPVYVYMVAKYTSRWSFFRAAALVCKAPRPLTVREVINPAKDRKLDEVAARHGVDPVRFRMVGGRLRWVWPLLP